jgi:acetyl esterase
MSIPAESSPNRRLAPAAEDLLRRIRASGFRGWSAMSVVQARAAILEMKLFAGQQEPVPRVESIRIAGRDESEILAQIYVPDSPKPVPTMVYMHGGGWVIGNHTGVDTVVRTLVNRSGCAILSIDYRLAPEHKFPAALNDVQAALSWVNDNSAKWGLDSDRVAVGGDSSGANLAAAASLLCRDRGGPTLVFQLLVYPVLDRNYQTRSYQLFGDGALSALSTADVMWFHNHYVNRSEDLELPYVSPLRAESLAGLPRTLLICAEMDPLLNDSIEYAQRLGQAAVPLEMEIIPGVFHGFWRMAGVLAEARQALNVAGDRMRHAMYLIAVILPGTTGAGLLVRAPTWSLATKHPRACWVNRYGIIQAQCFSFGDLSTLAH